MVTQTTDTGRQESQNFVYSPTNNIMPTALIVEDDEDNRQLLKVLFEMWNFSVIEARNGEEAVFLAKEKCPDLILMDIKLPLLDGFEAARQIRSSAKVANVPIIFLSGCAEHKFRASAADIGGNGYLVKPIDFDELHGLIETHIDFARPN